MVRLEAAFTAWSWSEAARLECAIKKLPKMQKERLIADQKLVQVLFAERLAGCEYRPVERQQLLAFEAAATKNVMGREDERE